ncbi:outer membrane beta-barrel protein [Sphingomonas sp. BT-65]|uniref:outer membrane beta-barrel protein n=1 Tax=Sphingomonas sp. BT-65 TaxID=2989821 RepID=UPI002235D686|nr:outer membrane beta-barrel protein [Sphingomonas sp. BT-65]MCW4463438.1 outer membrane beta-barrel protein [Sphingomonas sp. BT-65]
MAKRRSVPACRALPLIAVALAGTAPLGAQEVRRGASPLDLPRPGYERRPIRVGPAEMRIDVEIASIYDTNVYSTSQDEIDDIALVARPRVEIDWQSANAELHGEAYADTRRYLDQGRESATSFGAAVSGRMAPARNHSLSTELRFDRAVENRADPEARASILLPPRKINILTSEIGYALTGTRIGLNLTGGVQKFDFLDPAEGDRDFTMLRGSARATWRPAAPVSFFVEGYANRRNFRTAFDISGVNRDATTYGVLAGVSREVSARLRGRIGAGLFRFDPDDGALDGYTGFALSGDLTWNPRTRTAVTAQVFRGDVATARAGASGRTDTRVAVTVSQEAYHNVLLHGRAGWTQSKYRGVGSDTLNTWSLAAEGEYLVNRTFSIFAGADYARRSARDPLEEFSRAHVQVGLRARF